MFGKVATVADFAALRNCRAASLLTSKNINLSHESDEVPARSSIFS
jgi:hypothetical protein